MTLKTKFDVNDPAVVALMSLFKSVGVTPTKAAETVRNPKNAASLKELIHRNELSSKHFDEKQGSLVVHLAAQGGKLNPEQQDYTTKAIVDGKLKNIDQVTGLSSLLLGYVVPSEFTTQASIKYLETHLLPVDEHEFDSECGVGGSTPLFGRSHGPRRFSRSDSNFRADLSVCLRIPRFKFSSRLEWSELCSVRRQGNAESTLGKYV